MGKLSTFGELCVQSVLFCVIFAFMVTVFGLADRPFHETVFMTGLALVAAYMTRKVVAGLVRRK